MGHSIDCLIDTGAMISVLTVDAVIHINLQDAVQPTNKCFTSASSHSMHSQGELPQLPVDIGGVTCLVNFYVAPQGGYEMLLGMDVLMPRKACIDLGDKTLRLAKKPPEPGDDYVVCKKVPIDVRRACKSPMNYFRQCQIRASPEWIGFSEWPWLGQLMTPASPFLPDLIMPENFHLWESRRQSMYMANVIYSPPTSAHPYGCVQRSWAVQRNRWALFNPWNHQREFEDLKSSRDARRLGRSCRRLQRTVIGVRKFRPSQISWVH